MSTKDAEGITNSVDLISKGSLIWVCTVYPDLSVSKLRFITVSSLSQLIGKVIN